MRLTYIANARVPSEKAHPYQILKMCEALGERVDITLVLPFRVEANKQLRQIADWAKYYGLKKRIKITKLPSFDLIWLDLYTLKLGSLRFILQAFSFAFLATLYSLFKKADIYYTRDIFFASLFGYLKFLHGRNIYYEAHNFTPPVSGLVRRGRINGLIVITNKLKELYIKKGIPEGKILVAPDGVDLRMFDSKLSKDNARKELGLPLGGKVIGYVGQLHTMGMDKGANELVEAFKILREQIDDLSLCFVGGPEERVRQYSKLVKREGLKDGVIFTGQKPPYKVPLCMKAFDVCVMPFPWTEHYAYYMSPLKLFEYMASRRPIVASDLPSIREILNEENAILVEPGNAKALVEGINKVLQDEELATKVAENAYKDVQQYSWDKRVERILEFIGGNYSGVKI